MKKILVLTIFLFLFFFIISCTSEAPSEVNEEPTDSIEKTYEEKTEEVIQTINYEILYTDSQGRFDGGKVYYVLIEEVNNSNNNYKIDIKNIVRKIVKEKGNKISLNIFDHIKALENEYDYYVRGNISLLDYPNYFEYEKYHYIAGYDGNMETGAYN